MKSPRGRPWPSWVGRSPRGERGLKCQVLPGRCRLPRSLPSRGAWVEIMPARACKSFTASRSPRGERGLKYLIWRRQPPVHVRRSPRGERGLKCHSTTCSDGSLQSLPSRGARVEIDREAMPHDGSESLPSRGARVEIIIYGGARAPSGRRSPRGERGLRRTKSSVLGIQPIAPIAGNDGPKHCLDLRGLIS